ncbi:spermidine synthase [Aureococcus anophagefferens]|nr:spermidine synthase [Aureococcus anophagefferens]
MLSSWFRGGGARRAFATHSGADDAAVAQFRLKYAVTALRERVVTEFQTLEVYATSDVGNLLVIDGDAQLSEADEAHYHEMLAHVAVAAAASRADAELDASSSAAATSAARELLRHDRVSSVTVVDIDAQDDGEATTASHPLYGASTSSDAALTNDGVFVRNFTSLAPYPLDHARRNAAAVCDAFDKVRPFCWFQPCFSSRP